jgi:hypothetical protein
VNVRSEPSARVTWGLALLVPILAGGAAWLVADATVSAQACSTGTNSADAAALAGLVVLVLAGPITIAWHARGARPRFERILAPAVISVLLAVPVVYLGFQVWWSGHNCYT